MFLCWKLYLMEDCNRYSRIFEIIVWIWMITFIFSPIVLFKFERIIDLVNWGMVSLIYYSDYIYFWILIIHLLIPWWNVFGCWFYYFFGYNIDPIMYWWVYTFYIILWWKDIRCKLRIYLFVWIPNYKSWSHVQILMIIIYNR